MKSLCSIKNLKRKNGCWSWTVVCDEYEINANCRTDEFGHNIFTEQKDGSWLKLIRTDEIRIGDYTLSGARGVIRRYFNENYMFL